MATFHSARKRSDYLVRAKLYPTEQIVGLHKRKDKRCEVCLNVQETCFTNSVTNKVVDTGATWRIFDPQA